MDGLSIVTGIGLMVFLIFYLTSLFSNSNKFIMVIKTFLILFGLFIMAYIPSTIQYLDRDCTILSNSSYVCYLANGSYISNYGLGATSIGESLTSNYVYFVYIIFAFTIMMLIGWIGVSIYKWYKNKKYLK